MPELRFDMRRIDRHSLFERVQRRVPLLARKKGVAEIDAVRGDVRLGDGAHAVRGHGLVEAAELARTPCRDSKSRP